MSYEGETLSGLKYSIDPNNAYEGIKTSRLYQSMGLLPVFAISVHMSTPQDMDEACDMLMEQYQMGFADFGDSWGTIDEDGVYTSKYEEDPQMDPVGVFELTDNLLFYVYQSAIVGVYDKEAKTSKMTRMD